ncbi:MAG: cell division protein CrgA [Nocardioides sp.]|uniref:cell division protein CrgA n=1 Tax=Nocardioides sp. TaxID=35761 RepID=UPI003F01D547
MSKSKFVEEPKAKTLSVRLIIALLLVVAGIAWITWYYVGVRPDPMAMPVEKGSPKAIADLGRWNYVIGFASIMIGLIVSAHPDTPLGRGRGVVIGMLACFLIGLVWICVYYVFAQDLSKIWVFNDLQQWNLVVGIAFMGAGFAFATKWE